MNDQAVIPTGGDGRALSQFEPKKARESHEVRKARINLAARLGNTEVLEKEIDAKLDDEEDAVQWWRVTVRGKGQRRNGNPNNVDPALFVEEAEKILGFDQQTVSKWAKKLQKRDEYREQCVRAARKKLLLDAADNHRAEGTGENEWYTPSLYIEAARMALGAIDLDPATSVKANETVKAERIFTMKDNGLAQPWRGRVWLNPPYAQPYIGQFVEKLCTEFTGGNLQSAVLLTHNYTDTEWFHRAVKDCQLICFTRGRIAFESPSGEKAAPTQGQAFFYYGGDADAFRTHFSRFGFIR